MSLRDTWQSYCRSHLVHLARSTQVGYRSAMRHAIADLPATPSAADLQRWHRVEMPARFSRRHADYRLSVLRAVATAAGDAELGRALAGTRRLCRGRRPPWVPPADLLDRVLPLCLDLAERAWLLLAGRAGLRKGELLGLRPDDFDPETRVLHVLRQRESPERKNHRPHSVVLDAETSAAVAWSIAQGSRLRSPTGQFHGRSDGYLFPWGEKRVDAFLARLRAGLGADRERYLPHRQAWHVFRRWGATRLARSGATVWDVLRWLGDSSPDMAMSYVSLEQGEARSLECVPGSHGIGASAGRGNAGTSNVPADGEGRPPRPGSLALKPCVRIEVDKGSCQTAPRGAVLVWAGVS